MMKHKFGEGAGRLRRRARRYHDGTPSGCSHGLFLAIMRTGRRWRTKRVAMSLAGGERARLSSRSSRSSLIAWGARRGRFARIPTPVMACGMTTRPGLRRARGLRGPSGRRVDAAEGGWEASMERSRGPPEPGPQFSVDLGFVIASVGEVLEQGRRGRGLRRARTHLRRAGISQALMSPTQHSMVDRRCTWVATRSVLRPRTQGR